MTPKDWLMLTITSQREPIRIQKALFKLSRETDLPDDEIYDFRPYNWGPFSPAIYQDIDSLIMEGSVERTPQPGASWSTYCLTPTGSRRASALRRQADPGMVETLDHICSWIEERSFGELLRDLYAEYPDMAVNSLLTPAP